MNNIKQYSLKPSIICQLFDSFVGGTLNYASELWGFGKSKEIERIHLKFSKSLLNVKTSTTNMGVYGELGRYPLYITRHVCIIKYWSKIILSSNVLITKLYNNLLSSNNMNNWAYKVKSLLDSYGFSDVWINPYTVDLKNFFVVFKEF